MYRFKGDMLSFTWWMFVLLFWKINVMKYLKWTRNFKIDLGDGLLLYKDRVLLQKTMLPAFESGLYEQPLRYSWK